MSARRFIEHAVLWFADDGRCGDRKVAVGRTLPEQRSADRADVDWIYPVALGSGELAYFRNPYDARCEPDFDVRHRADELTRPHDSGGARPAGLRPGEGFYLDLVDDARTGPDALGAAPVYVERTDEGDGQVRLTYWMLFGMSDPLPNRPGTGHEGDWERVDVLLDHDGGDRYAPLAVQLESPNGPRDTAWSAIVRDGRRPIVVAARGTHAVRPAKRRAACADCIRWRTWETLLAARRQHWYGFGGAWGEPGPTDATTGPLGPHRHWGEHLGDP